jgi:hypothetical protein
VSQTRSAGAATEVVASKVGMSLTLTGHT